MQCAKVFMKLTFRLKALMNWLLAGGWRNNCIDAEEKIIDRIIQTGTGFATEWAGLGGNSYPPNYRLVSALKMLEIESDEYKLLVEISKIEDKNNRLKCSSLMHFLLDKVNLFKRFLKENLEPYHGVAYHYTNLSSLKKMIEESSIRDYDGLYVTLHESNAEYLNDPNEGEWFVDGIKSVNRGAFAMSDGLIEPRSEYLASLILEKEEHLPMWVQYGDNGQGCRIEFEIPDSDSEANELNPIDEKTFSK